MQVQLSTEFALHGLLYLASHREQQPLQLPEIARAIKVRESYLRKIFQQLVRAGLLEAFRGASGGYTLRLSPDQVSFYDVMKAIEGAPGNFRCYASQRACEINPGCPIIFGFCQAFNDFSERLKSYTLSDVLNTDEAQHKQVVWLQGSV